MKESKRSKVRLVNTIQCMGRPARTSKGSGIAEFLRTWRLLFWTIGLALLFPLFYAEENWRGQRAWERHKRTLESGSISTANYVPPRVPDSDNFAMTPFLAPLFEYIPAAPTAPVRWLDPKGFERATRFGVLFEEASQNVTPVRGSKSNSWLNTSADLAAWRSAFLKSTNAMVQSAISNTAPAMAAEGVLAALHEYELVFEELRKASARPHSRFNIYYEQADKPSILLPHLGVLRKLILILHLRASAELASGRTDNAFETVKLMLHLTDAPRDEPFLISYLVRLAMFRLSLQPIAEGIPQWTPDQLATLQQKLQQFDFCRDGKRSLEAERVFLGHELIEYLRTSPNQYALLSSWANGGKNAGDSWDAAWLLAVAPQGWLYLEQLNYDLAFQRYVLPAIDPAQKRIDPAFTLKTAGELENFLDDSQAGLVFEHRWFASMVSAVHHKLCPEGSLCPGWGQSCDDSLRLGTLPANERKFS